MTQYPSSHPPYSSRPSSPSRPQPSQSHPSRPSQPHPSSPSPRQSILTPANVIATLLLVALFIGSCVALWAAMQHSVSANTGTSTNLISANANVCAVVHDTNGNTRTLPLNEDTVVDIVTDKGCNTITVKDGTVRVTNADCENQDCIQQGALSAPGKQIICLPHELWIEVVNKSEGTDAVHHSMDTSIVAGENTDESNEPPNANEHEKPKKDETENELDALSR